MDEFDREVSAFCLHCQEHQDFAAHPRLERTEHGRLQLIGCCRECGGKLVAFVKLHRDGAPCSVKLSACHKLALQELARRLDCSERELLDTIVAEYLSTCDVAALLRARGKPKAGRGAPAPANESEGQDEEPFLRRLARWLLSGL